MIQWTLILILSYDGRVGGIGLTSIDGYTSLAKCQTAGRVWVNDFKLQHEASVKLPEYQCVPRG